MGRHRGRHLLPRVQIPLGQPAPVRRQLGRLHLWHRPRRAWALPRGTDRRRRGGRRRRAPRHRPRGAPPATATPTARASRERAAARCRRGSCRLRSRVTSSRRSPLSRLRCCPTARSRRSRRAACIRSPSSREHVRGPTRREGGGGCGATSASGACARRTGSTEVRGRPRCDSHTARSVDLVRICAEGNAARCRTMHSIGKGLAGGHSAQRCRRGHGRSPPARDRYGGGGPRPRPSPGASVRGVVGLCGRILMFYLFDGFLGNARAVRVSRLPRVF